MRWLLVGLCGLALVNLSAPLPKDFSITQIPRFYGVKASTNVVINCLCEQWRRRQVDWFWAKDSDSKPEPLSPNHNVGRGKTRQKNTLLLIENVGLSDSGIYFCKINNTWGPGTGLQVMKRPLNVSKAEKRSAMKDALILVQSLMLASCVAVPLVQKYILVKKDEAIYEDPQQDHTYEGLVVETCEGALYEDISSYAQTGGPEAPWED